MENILYRWWYKGKVMQNECYNPNQPKLYCAGKKKIRLQNLHMIYDLSKLLSGNLNRVWLR